MMLGSEQAITTIASAEDNLEPESTNSTLAIGSIP